MCSSVLILCVCLFSCCWVFFFVVFVFVSFLVLFRFCFVLLFLFYLFCFVFVLFLFCFLFCCYFCSFITMFSPQFYLVIFNISLECKFRSNKQTKFCQNVSNFNCGLSDYHNMISFQLKGYVPKIKKELI